MIAGQKTADTLPKEKICVIQRVRQVSRTILSNFRTNLFTHGEQVMTTVGLLVRLEAKPGKEQAVADFLKSGLSLAQAEPGTITWYGVQLGPSTFGIFDTFLDDAGRQAHLSGPIAAALMANAAELLATDPVIEMVDILAAK